MKRHVQYLLLPLMMLTSSNSMATEEAAETAVQSSADIPEVLRYAQKYVREQPDGHIPAKKAIQRTDSVAQKLARSEMARRQLQIKLNGQEKDLREMREKLRSVQKQELQSRAKEEITLLNAKKEAALLEASQSSRKQAATLEEKSKDVARLTKDKGELTAQVYALSNQVTLLTGTNRKLLSDKDSMQTVQEKTNKELMALRQQQTQKDSELRVRGEDIHRLTQELATSTTTQKTLNSRVSELEKQILVMKKEKEAGDMLSLKSEAARQAYASGVMYARDVREASEGNRLLGLKNDSVALSAGLNDALANRKLRMTPVELEKAIQSLEIVAERGFRRVTQAQKKSADTYLKEFRKMKGSIRHDLGFWYLVTHQGDGRTLKPDDTVDVVVEEMLTDGTVISDMETAGSSLRQAVQDYPPVFVAVLEKLKNHGQVTLVVPPELAYGDRGYPPKVPPGATMVYKLRVVKMISNPTLGQGNAAE
ncbi:hypothetical protein JVY03_004508 [Salmonella enterica]|nr:hypothetical protein [Salmonella enterica]EGS7015750.1 hypothetical protein [Salmonella enterica]EHB8486202.1 hypothetical protein [Salmonella enterica]